jgi:putative transposase
VPYSPTAFQRLMEPLDRRTIARAVAAHDGDKGVGRGDNAWTCERHLKAMVFAQLAGLTSLREIITGLAAHSRWFYHLNMRPPCRSTLSDANAARPAPVFRDLAADLMAIAGRSLRKKGNELIRLLDSTPIPLKAQAFPWAEANSRTRGLKLHVLHDSRHGHPVWFDVTSAKTDDTVAGRGAPLEAGATYVYDKGYTDFGRWRQIIDAGAFFVTRRKYNTHRRQIGEQPVQGEGILADRRLKIGHRRACGGAPLNPLYDIDLREIEVDRPDHDKPLYLLTNDHQRPAREIASLYKERWDIELLFKWLKQNLKIRSFLGRSENAVRIQIYVALIAFVLLRIFHQTAACSFKDSTTKLLTRLKLGLCGPLDLCTHSTPPPKPPDARLPCQQACLVFI